MKVLVISARYPPYHLGGYEIRCKDILDELSRRGHEVLVITSRKEIAALREPQPRACHEILRKLRVRARTKSLIDQLTRWRVTYLTGMLLTFARELLLDLLELRFVDRQVELFHPDVVYIGHITCLSRSIMPYLADRRMPIVYDEGGSGLIDCWSEKNIWYKFTDEYIPRHAVTKVLKSFVVDTVCRFSGRRLKPRFAWPGSMHVFFNDELNRKNALAKGVPMTGAEVIHSGVDTEKFRFRSRSGLSAPVRIVVPGRIEPRKGQMDGVKLLAKLRESGVEANMTIVGATWSEAYYRELTDEIRKLDLGDKVRLMPMVSQDELADLYQKADICFFPSYYRTGFSRVPLEAMACGCITISYGNEGSDEIIRNGQTGFLVEPGDLPGTARIVEELTSNPDMVGKIASAARKEIEEKCSMQTYVDRVEAVLTAPAPRECARDLNSTREG